MLPLKNYPDDTVETFLADLIADFEGWTHNRLARRKTWGKEDDTEGRLTTISVGVNAELWERAIALQKRIRRAKEEDAV